jgi:hypothetical protein
VIAFLPPPRRAGRSSSPRSRTSPCGRPSRGESSADRRAPRRGSRRGRAVSPGWPSAWPRPRPRSSRRTGRTRWRENRGGPLRARRGRPPRTCRPPLRRPRARGPAWPASGIPASGGEGASASIHSDQRERQRDPPPAEEPRRCGPRTRHDGGHDTRACYPRAMCLSCLRAVAPPAPAARASTTRA